MKRSDGCDVFMTDLLLRCKFGPSAAPGYLLFRSLFLRPIYCMPIAKQLRTPAPQSHTRICNGHTAAASIRDAPTPFHAQFQGIRTDTASIRSVPATPEYPFYPPIQLHFDESETIMKPRLLAIARFADQYRSAVGRRPDIHWP